MSISLIILHLKSNKVLFSIKDTDGQVTHWEANSFAQENGLQFVETSALTGENIDEAFATCVRGILTKVKVGELDVDRYAVGGSTGLKQR